jgi:hypothetical protein
MITVYQISKEATLSTRLFLPSTTWGACVLQNLHDKGYEISECANQVQHPDPRGPLELARRDALLDMASPY